MATNIRREHTAQGSCAAKRMGDSMETVYLALIRFSFCFDLFLVNFGLDADLLSICCEPKY